MKFLHRRKCRFWFLVCGVGFCAAVAQDTQETQCHLFSRTSFLGFLCLSRVGKCFKSNKQKNYAEVDKKT